MNKARGVAQPQPAVPADSVRRAAVNAALEAMVTVDGQQRIVMINPAALRMFGCSAADALGADLARFIPAASRTAHARHVREFDTSGLTERYGDKVPLSNFDGAPALTEMDALVAYLQMLGTQVNFKLYDNKANIR